MDFQRLLLDIGNSLSKDEVKAMAFLCADLLGRNPMSVESASDLFSRLADQDLLSSDQPHLLTELLVTIQRTRLVRYLNLPDPQSATGNISPFRKLLYNLSEEITDDDLKQIKFLLNKTLPRRKLEENVTTLDVFVEMEHMDLLSDTNLNKLETIIQSVCPMLKEKINEFKALQERQFIIAQETGQPEGNQFLHHGITASGHMPALQPSAKNFRHYSCTSMGKLLLGFVILHLKLLFMCSGFIYSQSPLNHFLDMLCGGDECEALPQQLSALGLETSNSASLSVRSDALEIQLQGENENITRREMVESANTNSEDLESYCMTSRKRGVCVIINNYEFIKLKKREGTNLDKESLRDVFMWLGFKVEIHNDCSSTDMRSLLRELGRRDHSQMDGVVCCILSHGKEGCVYGADDLPVTFTELCKPLNGLSCPSLADKPKLFFVQACQGTSEQQAVYIESDDHTGTLCSDAVALTESIPADADFLFAMSTVPSFVSYRDTKNGSWFIQSLCQNLVQMVDRGCDLVSILTKVNADVSKKTDSAGIKKQMPQPAFTLRKKVVFPLPTASPPRLPPA
ncbi:caspase-8 isoform X2 [Anabas testudineus]|uniref:Caspase-8 n=1 Tax=Anabas testudineus TaxID=64144 RepID=A0AAQ6IMS8_ANATE|nr:caspase-8 isoform X2 [Anabas testudineus]